MKDNEPQRNGSFSDADLATDCDENLVALTDNLDALDEEGLTKEMLAAFSTDIAAFRALPTDESLLNTIGMNTQRRDAAYLARILETLELRADATQSLQ